MEISNLLNADTILNILLIVMFLTLIFSLILKKNNKTLRDEENTLIKKKYPHLSDKDMKYRKECINSYIRIYSDRYSKKFELSIFLSIMIFLTSGALFVYLTLANPLGTDFCLALLLLLVSAVALSNPKYEIEQTFWTNYLEKYPDNPLMVIVSPAEKSKKAAKSAKILGFYFLFWGLFSLIATCLIFLQIF